jgi:hypothetical protein
LFKARNVGKPEVGNPGSGMVFLTLGTVGKDSNHDTDRTKNRTFRDSFLLTGFKLIVIGRLAVKALATCEVHEALPSKHWKKDAALMQFLQSL